MRNPSGVLRAWLHDRPLVPDAALAVVTTALAVLLLRSVPSPEGAQDGPAVALTVACCLSLALRRRAPFPLLLVVCLAGVALATLGLDGLPLWPAVLVLVYTVAAHRGLALSLCGLAWSFVCHFASAAVGGTLGDWGLHLPVTVLTVTLWITGRSVRLRRAYLEELRDRARRTEWAREADTRAARAEERSRIARELHDVVAHHVSVMTVQASAARRVLATNPEGAREALSAIEEMGRTAMAEMRNIVGVLRTDASPAERNPQPGVAEIPALVDQMREAGLRAQLWVEGVPGALPPGVDLAAYRLVQEALTNSLRHAGPLARAWVTVRHEHGQLAVQVEDDGRGTSGEAGAGEGSGHGLVGIRERVALYGGVLRIGPRPEGGFEVNARFPLKDV
ncbi:sensor histidine kinase [Streptosporangium saharense]|uniref:histidine kinase n=1 Tax=Streptosporangium saharense TaxID=1706840 RepID=A0A7W7VRC0_9ACTN|nr:sensor histidine kinase [Streptosporangium saharense]MBB4919573.1 signal transduction histidine kinase [Streptosporangium saharense]